MFNTLPYKRDFYAGMLMTLLGIGVTFNSMSYNLGTLMHMGPGMFPFLLGILLTGLGLMIFGSAVVTPLGKDEHVLPKQKRMARLGLHSDGPDRFIIFGEYFGMVPATFSCVFVSAMGDREATLKTRPCWRPASPSSACCYSPTCCKFRSHCSGGAH